MKRPPIVVVMGHVDHGKTTLLDYILKTNTAAKEVGGITQSIGAYEIEHNGNKITFIDTPGHQIFSNMRKYGAKIADLAVLVVAADDGVKPQTKEAIKIITESKIPFIVAINKIDKLNSDPEKTRLQLLQEGILLEKYGGNISWEEISAKTGQGIDALLDLIILTAEMESLEYEKDKGAYGIILKSSKSHARGIVASGVLKNGVIKIGQLIATKTASGKIKTLANFFGKKINSAEPSSPVEIIGFENLPEPGEEFFAGENLDINLIKKEAKKEINKKMEDEEETEKILKVILKADETSSLESLEDFIKSLSEAKTKKIFIISKSVGNLTEADIKNAAVFKAIIVAFKSKKDKAALSLAKSQNVKIIESEIIYELEKKINEFLEAEDKKDISGKRTVKILKTFGTAEGKKQIIGGIVEKGFVKNQESFEVWNEEEKLGEGKIINLQSQKKDVKEATENAEVGLLVESDVLIKENLKLVFD